MEIILYFLSFLILVVVLFSYLRLARYFKVLDIPNARSSHDYIVIRGGGIIFPVAVLLYAVAFEMPGVWLLVALLLISILSFMSDVQIGSFKMMLLGHVVAVGLLFWQTGLWEMPWYAFVIGYLATLAWINAFNFMDGINGITSFYSIVALLTFWWLNLEVAFLPAPPIVLLLLALLVFSFFNVRKRAIAFAGDVGSISMAFLLAWFMIALMQTTGRVEYILLFSVYGIDSAITILYRLKRGENIFEAHRSHLYQYLCNELQWPHLRVSAIYAITQAVLNGLTITLIRQEWMSWPVFSAFLFMQVLIYLVVRHRVSKWIEVAG